MIAKIKQKTKELIAANKTEATLALLLDYYRSEGNDFMYDEILLHSSKYKEIVSSHRKGLINREDYMTMLARINLALVQIVNNEEVDVEKNKLKRKKDSFLKDKKQKQKEKKFNALKIIFICLLVGLVGVELYSYIYSTEQLTVYVHGEKGKQEVITGLDANLILDFGNDRRVAKVGESGRTNFGEIPRKFLNKAISINLESDRYKIDENNEDVIYTGAPIYLKLKERQPNALIRGVVLDRNSHELLEGVSIIVDSIVVVTDSLGKFSLETTKNTIGKHLVIFSKKGYATKREYYIETPNPIEIRLNKLQDQ